MAEIPVKKTGGVPWWLWLLFALLIVGLIWFFFLKADEDEVETAVAEEPVAAAPLTTGEPAELEATEVVPASTAVDGGSADAGPITELAVLTGQNRTALIGRDVRLTGVQVLEMVGDRTFFVGTDAGSRVFVLLNEVPSLPDDAININVGQTINLTGDVRRATETVNGQPVAGLPAGTDAYIFAETAEVIERR